MIFDEAQHTFYPRHKTGKGRPRVTYKIGLEPSQSISRRTKHMKAIIKRMDEVCAAAGFSFAEEFVKIAQRITEGDLEDPDYKLAAMKIFLQAQEYIEPKKRSTTINVNNRPAAELTEAELRELAGIVEQDGSGSGTAIEARSTVIPFRLRAADEPVSDAIEAPRLPTE